jgi:L-ascorbate metabolism protein UlaG (beta-lactamase superfamily)
LRNQGWLPAPDALGAVDVVLVSHLHRDHADLPSLALFGARARVVVPRGAGPFLERALGRPVDELGAGDSVDIGAVRVRATPAVHDGRRGVGGPTAQAVGYVVTGAASVYVAGDTDLFPQMRTIPDGRGRRLDLALVPVGGWGLTLGPGHLDPMRAARALELLRPRVAVPVHWQTLRVPLAWRLRPHLYRCPGPEFASQAARLAPDTRTVVLRPGERLQVPS